MKRDPNKENFSNDQESVNWDVGKFLVQRRVGVKPVVRRKVLYESLQLVIQSKVLVRQVRKGRGHLHTTEIWKKA